MGKVKCGIDPGARTLIMGYYDYGPNEPAPNTAIRDHFKQLDRRKRNDPNYRVKESLVAKNVVTAVKRKDTNDHLYEFSADKYYYDIKVNESNKQTRLARYNYSGPVRTVVNGQMRVEEKTVIQVERGMPSKKTINIDKYMAYVK